jgi:hypothetical protein
MSDSDGNSGHVTLTPSENSSESKTNTRTGKTYIHEHEL